MVSHIHSKPRMPLHRLPVNEFVIDNIHIKGGEQGKGISPDILLEISKNVHDPFSKLLIRNMPDDREIIRLVGSMIEPRVNIYEPPELDTSLEDSSNCTEGATSSKSIDSDPSIEASSNESIPNKAAYERDSMLMYAIRYAQLTQNPYVMVSLLNMDSIPDIEQNASEVLGGQRPYETFEQTLHRSRMLWEKVVSSIDAEIKVGSNDDVPQSDGHASAAIIPRYGLDKSISEALHYDSNDYNTQPTRIITRLVNSDKTPRNATIVIQSTNGKYNILATYQELPKGYAYTQDFSSTSSERSSTSVSDTSAEYSFPDVLTQLQGARYCKIVSLKKHPFTELPVDAVVNETDPQLTFSDQRGIFNDITKAAGKETLKQEGKEEREHWNDTNVLARCHPGNAVITGAGKLKRKNGTTEKLVHITTQSMKGKNKVSNAEAYSNLSRSYNSVINKVSADNSGKAEADKTHSIYIPVVEDTSKGYDDVSIKLSHLIKVVSASASRLKRENMMLIVGCAKDKDVEYAQDIMLRRAHDACMLRL